MDLGLKILATPLIPLLYAYFELGGNWFALRLFQKGPSLWSVSGTLFFSVVYSLVSAYVALKLKMDMGLLMVCYGFGFSAVSIFLRLEWGKIPSFSSDLLNAHELLWFVAAIAAVGFLVSGYLVITSEPHH